MYFVLRRLEQIKFTLFYIYTAPGQILYILALRSLQKNKVFLCDKLNIALRLYAFARNIFQGASHISLKSIFRKGAETQS